MIKFVKKKYQDIKEYRQIKAVSFSNIKSVPNFKQVVKDNTEKKYGVSLDRGTLIDLIMFIEDWENYIYIVNNKPNKQLVDYLLKEDIDINDVSSVSNAVRKITGKYNSYKDKTVYDKFIDEATLTAYNKQKENKNVIAVTEEELQEALEAVEILKRSSFWDEFNFSTVYTQVVLQHRIEINNRIVNIKGLADFIIENSEQIVIGDLKVSEDRWKAFRQNKWALQAAMYSYMYCNMFTDKADKLKKFVWLVYEPEYKQVYKMKVEFDGKYLIDENLKNMGYGEEDSSIIYQYLVGSQSSNVMSLWERISYFLIIKDSGYNKDPKSDEYEEIKPIPPYNI